MTSATVGAIDIVAWFVYLFSAVLFVVGLHFMNSPKTARKGNQISAFGMVVAVLMAFIVLFAKGFVNIVAVVVLVVGILIGAVAGVVSAKKVKMTDMPQLVSVFNTVGGGAAALVALNDILTKEGTPDIVVLITAGLGILIGSVTFTGSLIAAGKLQGIKWVKKLNLPGKGVWNILFAVLSVVSLVMLCVQPEQRLLWSILTTVFALCYGLVFVIPIGGADMPVVISVLNACTGTAVAMSGLAIDNVALIVAGALVGAAGVTLSILMAQAMNRPLLSVLPVASAVVPGRRCWRRSGRHHEGDHAGRSPFSWSTRRRSSSCPASVWLRLRPSASSPTSANCSRATAWKSPTPFTRSQDVCLAT